MESGHLTPPLPEPVRAYLAVLAGLLPVGRRARAHVLDEIEDGLACAIEARTADGRPLEAAAHEAVAEFGDPRSLAHGVLRQVAAARAHRIGAGLVLTGPLVGAVWVTAFAAPTGAFAAIGAIASAVPLLLVAVAVAVPCAVLAFAAGTRHGAAFGEAGIPAALVATAACCCADLMLLAHAAAIGVRGLVLLAVCVSGVRLALAATAGGRLARLRAAAN